MSSHLVAGARRRSLMNSLAALGLVRVLAEQTDPLLRCAYTPDGLRIDCAVDDLATWLVETYRPTPVLSPWNEGSGFGAKDKAPKVALASLLAIASPRLDEYRAAVKTVSTLAETARREGWDKARHVRAVRDRCPDSMLPWLDSAVIALGVRERDLAFPPLLGSGGNDGRLEFSTNFHQRLLEVLPTSDSSDTRSRALAQDWLDGTSAQSLVRAAIGQFDPGGAGTPNSSPFGAAESIVNPWTFVLMVEGSMMFTAAPARRLSDQAKSSSRAAMTFTTFGSQFGTNTGTAAEESRGEVWFPWWNRTLSFNDVRALFAEGRAVWRGRTAIQSDQMYLAAATRGVSSGIDGFDRYTIVKRNGLAFSAVLADSVTTRDDQSLLLIAELEDWPNLVARRSDLPSTVQESVSRFRAARVRMARGDTDRVHVVRELLSAVTLLELAVSRSGNVRREVSPRRVPGVEQFARLLTSTTFAGLLDIPEFRIAAGMASIATGPLPSAPQGRTMREILIALDPPGGGTSKLAQWRDSAAVPGLAIVRPDQLFGDVARWLAVNAGTDVVSRPTESGPRLNAQARVHGFRGPQVGIEVPSADLHAWVRGALDWDTIYQWFVALMAFNWRGKHLALPRPANSLIDPTFALLAPFRDGIRAGTDTDTPSYGLTAEWIYQLTAGKVDRVHAEVSQRLRQLGRDAVISRQGQANNTGHGRRIAAALLPRSTNPGLALGYTTRLLRAPEDPARPTAATPTHVGATIKETS